MALSQRLVAVGLTAVLVASTVAHRPVHVNEADVSLEDAVRRAVASNLDLIAQRQSLAAAREELERMALEAPRIPEILGGKAPVRIIVVPDRLVNIVVK